LFGLRTLIFGRTRGASSISAIGSVDAAGVQLEPIGRKPPVRDPAEPLIAPLGSFDRTVGISRAPDFYGALEAFEGMAIRAKQILEEAHAILGHGDVLGGDD
jgi:hypothetical protein